LLVLACGRAEPGAVMTIKVEPAEITAQVRPGEPAEVGFTALATYSSGEEVPLSLVSWSTSNLSSGEIDSGGVFSSVDTNGGVTEIIATHDGVEGRATLTLVYTESFYEYDIEPELVEEFESGTPSYEDNLPFYYPPDGVTVPRNLDGLGFFWQTYEELNSYRLRMRSDITDISIYIGNQHTWFASADLWTLAAAANPSGTVEVQMEAGLWDGQSLNNHIVGPPITLTVNRLDARGSVLYWSTTAEGILRIPLGSTEATPFWVSKDTGGYCVGCHVVSSVTDQMAVGYDGINGRFAAVDVTEPEQPATIWERLDTYPRITFKAITPDGRWLVGTNQGEISVYEMSTGQAVGSYDMGKYPLTQPDFAPDGQSLVMVRSRGAHPNEFAFEEGEIVAIPWNDDRPVLEDLITLVPHVEGVNFYYPAISPDGQWVAYNRTIGPGYSSPYAELWLVKRDGTVNVRLDNANGEGTENQNSYPRWGPLPDDDVLWLAYSSRRSYPFSSYTQPQVWLSAIDTAAAVEGGDPSAAPFRLPGQDVSSDNHLPFWWDR